METENFLIEFGLRVKKARLKLNMSQEELAKKSGYSSRSTINKIELGTNGVPQTKVQAIASALGVSPAYLMGWDEDLSKDDALALVKEITEYTNKQMITWGVLPNKYKKSDGTTSLLYLALYSGIGENGTYSFQNIKTEETSFRLTIHANTPNTNPIIIQDGFYGDPFRNLLDNLRKAITKQIDSHRPLSPADKVFEGLSESQSKELENYADFIRFRDEIGIEEIKKMMAEKDKPEEQAEDSPDTKGF